MKIVKQAEDPMLVTRKLDQHDFGDFISGLGTKYIGNSDEARQDFL